MAFSNVCESIWKRGSLTKQLINTFLKKQTHTFRQDSGSHKNPSSWIQGGGIKRLACFKHYMSQQHGGGAQSEAEQPLNIHLPVYLLPQSSPCPSRLGYDENPTGITAWLRIWQTNHIYWISHACRHLCKLTQGPRAPHTSAATQDGWRDYICTHTGDPPEVCESYSV